MQNNFSNDESDNKIITFFKSIKFANEELTEESKAYINKKVEETQLKGFFKLIFWKKQNTQKILKNKAFIVLLEYLIANYIEKIVISEKIEIYNLLLYFKWKSNENQSGLNLVQVIEKDIIENNIDTLYLKGGIYRNVKHFKEALECYYRALEIISTKESKNDIAFYINNSIGLVYTNQKKFEQAKIIFKTNLQQQKSLKNKAEISTCYTNLASNCVEQKNYKEAISYYLKALKLKKELEELESVEVININLVVCYIETSQIDLAQKFINLSKKSLIQNVRQLTERLDLRIALKQFEELDKPTSRDKELLNKKANISLGSVEKIEICHHKISNYDYIAKAYEYAEKPADAIAALRKKFELFSKQVKIEEEKSYKQLRESHEVQLRQMEIERKELIILQKTNINDKLQQVNKDLESFTAIASHDLKSPLRNIIAFSSLIEDKETSREEITELASEIKKDGQKMSNLISSLLNYSKIGYNDIDLEHINLNEIIGDVIKGLKKEIKNKKALVKVELLSEIKGNTILLQQLFDNLITNALKYNDKEKPEISIKYNKTQNTIEIQDNGIGIPENKIQDVFKAFIRAHSASKYEGSGVGLATCKKIMDIHSGTISVSSEVGKGSCFSLCFND